VGNVAVILMTWNRVSALKHTLSQLSRQTYKEFSLYLSNGNLDEKVVKTINQLVARFNNKINIVLTHDGNDFKSFRRLFVAKRAVLDGNSVILFIDDDVQVPSDYIQNCLEQYEPQTYKSGYAWSFTDGDKDYYKNRKRQYDNRKRIHYCGTGVAMIDGSIFLQDKLFNAPNGALGIEDLWLSYYADHIMGWRLMHMNIPGVSIEGGDIFALHREYMNADYNKTHFLKELAAAGWNLEPASYRLDKV
jgi:glycosyltransferase involved in cell wall biosynthesis